jgi:hypothetical protein
MAHKRKVALVLYLAPTEDDNKVNLQEYKTPQDFRNAFKSEALRPPKWKMGYETDFPPKHQPKFGNTRTGCHYLLTYDAQNKFPEKHLADIAAGKTSQEPPLTSAWKQMEMDFSFLKKRCKNIYYLGEDEEKPSERPEDEGRDDPIPSIERDENNNLYTSPT